MRARDYLGFPLLVVGVSDVMLGHHWFGMIWFWLGVAVTTLGLAIVSSGGLEEKIDGALRFHRGPGDFGNRDYHVGSRNSHSNDSGEGGGGGGD